MFQSKNAGDTKGIELQKYARMKVMYNSLLSTLGNQNIERLLDIAHGKNCAYKMLCQRYRGK